MKFFNKTWLTLAELIISIAISAMIFWIVIFFTSSNIQELSSSQLKTNTMKEIVFFADYLKELKNNWFTDVEIIEFSFDSTYNWWTNPNPNNILIFRKPDSSEAISLGIVNKDNMLLQKYYTYWNNFLWYRRLTEEELVRLNINREEIFLKTFQPLWESQIVRIKDFVGEFYNSWDILDINVSYISWMSESIIWEDYSEINIEDNIIGENNFVF